MQVMNNMPTRIELIEEFFADSNQPAKVYGVKVEAFGVHMNNSGSLATATAGGHQKHITISGKSYYDDTARWARIHFLEGDVSAPEFTNQTIQMALPMADFDSVWQLLNGTQDCYVIYIESPNIKRKYATLVYFQQR